MSTHALLIVTLAVSSGQPAVRNGASAVQTQAQIGADALGEAYYLFMRGREQEDGDDLPGAVESYRKALEVVPEAAGIRAALASAYARRGQIPEAQTHATRALVSDPDNREAHRLLGLIQSAAFDQGPAQPAAQDIREAIGHLERATVGASPDLVVQLTLGDLYLRSEQYAKSVTVLRQFLLARPGYARAIDLLARAYRASGQPEQAMKLLDEFKRDVPDATEASRTEAERLEQGGRWKEAANLWAAIVSSGPAGAGYRTRLAAALANAGDLAGSRDVLVNITRDSANDVAAWYLLSQVEGRGGNLVGAETAAKRISEIDPRDPRGPLALAHVRAAAGNDRGAVEVLEPRVKSASADEILSGVYADMVGELAAAFSRLGQNGRVVETLEAARKRLPTDDQILFSLAAAYDQNRQFGQAERAFRDIITANPKHALALNYLGYMLANRGQKLEEALGLINRALAIEVDNPSYLDSLGWARYFKLKRLEEARDPLERAATAMPNASVVQDHLGDLYFQMKRYRDAETAFNRALAGDRDGVDVTTVTEKRDRARALGAQ